MSRAIASFFDLESGEIVATWRGPAHALQANTPPGCGALTGEHDARRVRVDVASGLPVPFYPPRPTDDEWSTWAWDEWAWCWQAMPTAAALARDIRAERDRRLAASDWTESNGAQARLGADASSAWSTYRQALFDLTDQADFPQSVIWPEPPCN